MISNLAWTLVTDNSFKEIGRAAWYPYPTLSVGYYMHTTGYLMILICDGVFGYIVMPNVWKYDPAQEKLDKLKDKQAKRQQREQAYQQKKQQLANVVAGQHQQQQYPPGYGQQPQPYGYGQQPPAYGQQPPPQ